MTKTAFDLKHVKSVCCIALLHEGRVAGRIVANYSDNPNGSVCTATIHVWGGPLNNLPSMTGKAGGYGYDKLEAAVSDSLRECGKAFPSIDNRTFETYFRDAGYEVHHLI